MKTYQTLKLGRGLLAAVGGFALFTGALQAAPFVYSPGDLVLTFRKTGGTLDYAVNIGKATNYNAVPSGSTLAVGNLSTAQLSSAFANYNNLLWAVSAANRPPVDTNYPLQTIWTTSPRTDAETRAPAWLRKGASGQGIGAAQIDAVGLNAASYSSSVPSGASNTVTGVIIPSGNDYALTPVIGEGDYVGQFQGNVQSLTDSNFVANAANVSRADLYELIPGTTAGGTYNTPGRYLGYFELKPDGTLTFNTLPPRPVITSVSRTGDITTVSFTTVTNATYSLVVTNGAGFGTPRTNWVVGSSLAGTGAVLSLTDTNSVDDSRFYGVKAQ